MNQRRPDLPQLELCARDLCVSYDDSFALELPYLNLHGRIIAVIGHNGSGKSTLIKSILGLLPPKTGELAASFQQNGESTLLIPEKHMAFSPETGAVFADVPVESYIKLWCRIKCDRANYYRKEGSHYIERLDIQPLLKKLGRELSKGQRRRVQSVVGFLSQPKLFLFDEPFDGLDIAQSNQLSNLMLEESRRMTMIVSSHRMEVVERMADLVIVLERGKVITYGTVEEVCAVLCGQSVLITDSGLSTDDILPALQEHFFSCLVSSIGSEVSITGSEIDLEALYELLHRLKCEGAKLKVVRPSLVDAMQYHLKKLH
ncbi:MAG: ABC transporter ATP-binding protein [Bdellovibrionota bacterium]